MDIMYTWYHYLRTSYDKITFILNISRFIKKESHIDHHTKDCKGCHTETVNSQEVWFVRLNVVLQTLEKKPIVISILYMAGP